jgi:Flp pilus assembly pilin Flp
VNNILLKLHVRLQELLNGEDGQDMVEYALVIALIGFGATTSSQFLAQGLSQAFSNISTTLGSYTA